MRQPQQAELARDADQLLHGTTQQDHHAARLCSDVAERLHAEEIRRKERHEDRLMGLRDSGTQPFARVTLRARTPRPLHVGGVGEEHLHPLLSKLTEPRQIGRRLVERVGIELEVGGVHEEARRGADRQRAGLRDAVVHMDGLDLKGPHLEPAPRLELADDHPIIEVTLLQRRTDHLGCERRCVDRQIDLLEQVGHRADVVEVAVGDDEPCDAGLVLHQPVEIRHHQLNPQRLLVREGHSAVDDQQHPVLLEDGTVHSNLTKAAKGGKSYGMCQV